jgi:hypothetical protein
MLSFHSSCTWKRRLQQTRLMPVMPWRTICAVTLIGFRASSACCAKRNCFASYARRGLHQSSVTLSSATFIQDSLKIPSSIIPIDGHGERRYFFLLSTRRRLPVHGEPQVTTPWARLCWWPILWQIALQNLQADYCG